MKICIVSGIFPPDIGGPATHLLNLCAKLKALGHNIHIITFGDGNEDLPFSVQKISRKIPAPLRLSLAFIKIIRLHKEIDIIFSLGGPWDSGIPALLAKIILAKPLVTKVSGDIAWERARIKHLTEDNIGQFQAKRYSFRIEFFRRIQVFALKKADKIIVPSNYLRAVVEGWGISPDKIELVHNALPHDPGSRLSQAEARKKIGIDAETAKIMLIVARMTPWKGIDLLLRALPQLNDGVKLLAVGEGPAAADLKRLAFAAGVGNRVVFAGYVARNKINLYLRAADLFVLPSSYEGMPHTLLEAMAAGLPVVAANVGGIPEIIEDGKEGTLFTPQDVGHLKTSVNRMLEDKALALRLAENAKEKLKQFDFDILSERITGIFGGLVNGRQAR